MDTGVASLESDDAVVNVGQGDASPAGAVGSGPSSSSSSSSYAVVNHLLRDMHLERRQRLQDKATTLLACGAVLRLVQRPAESIGSFVWAGALVLAHWLEAHPDVVRGRTVVELGAGIGVASIVAALLAPKLMCCTDLDVVLPLIRCNADANLGGGEGEGEGEGHVGVQRERFHVQELQWGNRGHEREALQLLTHATHDAGGPRAPRGYDVVMAADVVYRPDLFPALLGSMQRLLGPRGVVLIAYRERGAAEKDFWAAFDEHFNRHEIDASGLRQPQSGGKPVRLFTGRWKASPVPPEHSPNAK